MSNKYKSIRMGIYEEILENDSKLKQKKELLESSRGFSKDIYDKGEEWFNSGLTLDDAPDEYRNNSSFKSGFEKGKRIALGRQIQEDMKKSKTK